MEKGTDKRSKLITVHLTYIQAYVRTYIYTPLISKLFGVENKCEIGHKITKESN